jgi:hypothetical protein
VIETVREKRSCIGCEKITQADGYIELEDRACDQLCRASVTHWGSAVVRTN